VGKSKTPDQTVKHPWVSASTLSIYGALILWVMFFLFRNYSALLGGELDSFDYMSKLRAPQPMDRHIFEVFIDDDARDTLFASPSGRRLNPKAVMDTIRVIEDGKPALIAVDIQTDIAQYNELRKRISSDIPIIWATGMAPPEPPNFWAVSDIPDYHGRRYRRVQLVGSKPYDSFAFAILRHLCATGRVSGGACELPTACGSETKCIVPFLIPYSGSAPRRMPATVVLRKGSNPEAPWKNSIVFLGGRFEGEDSYATPAGNLYGVDIHVEALAALIDGRAVDVRNRWLVILAEGVALLLLFFAQHWISNVYWKLRIAVILIGAAVLSICLSWFAFGKVLYFLNFVPLLLGVLLDDLHDVAMKNFFRKKSAQPAIEEPKANDASVPK
jgi:CHASE2 domain-containing sensor protein